MDSLDKARIKRLVEKLHELGVHTEAELNQRLKESKLDIGIFVQPVNTKEKVS